MKKHLSFPISRFLLSILMLILFFWASLSSCEKKEEVSITYSVTFDSNGGSAITTQTVKPNTMAIQPSNPTRNNYFFDGWYKDISLTTSFDFNEPITSNITLYAKWLIVPIVTFNTNGGSQITPQPVTPGGTATKPANPTRVGYTFISWYKDQDLKLNFAFTTRITSSITLYAKWEQDPLLITFNSNGGSLVSPISAKYNSTIAQPANPTKAGYSFAGWYTDAALTMPFDFSIHIQQSITLYAKWI